ncbi:MAG: hypothetical protein COB07_05930 [Sulfurovum sp.]|nr:MAG: hypothetical protein COB07_05930 [Sulfurovum sp.]
MKSDFLVKGGKSTAVLGTFDGKHFEPLKPQMPGMVSPMQKADGLMLISPNVKMLKDGRAVNMIPIKWDCYSMHEEELFSE